jgi:hypothetical protein
MTSPADADAPLPAQRGADSGWGMKIALGVVGFILIVLFVLPGFMAAGFSRTGHSIHLVNSVVWGYTSYGNTEPITLRVELWILTPAKFLMWYSVPVRRFYRWQYRLAGGEEIYESVLVTKVPPPDESGK